MNRYRPIKKYRDGGPGLSDRQWKLMTGFDDPYLTADLPLVQTSSTPPGTGQSINLPTTSSMTWQPVNQVAVAEPNSASRRIDWNRAGQIGQSLAPYVSNIVNAFRRAPTPAQPIMDSPPVFQKVNYDADRLQVDREIAAANTGADRTLAGNQATAVRQFNMGQKLNELSKINERERNTNIGISNQQAYVNAQVGASNNAKVEDYNQSMVERNVAQQREQAANLANAADKYVAIQNEVRKADTDKQKARILSSVYEKSGVLQRQGMSWRAQGLPDPFGENYKWLKS